MTRHRFWTAPLSLASALLATPAHADAPELISVEKIWDRGAHNAFTDLARWRGKWYCTFREADAHVGGDGKLRVLESADGKAWEPVALIAEEGIDLRDPKLSVTPKDLLMISAGGSVYGGTRTLMGIQPRVSFSSDGRAWSAPRRVLSEGEWLWRVTWHEGKAYGASYSLPASRAPKGAVKGGNPPPSADGGLKLYVGTDGIQYELVTRLDVPDFPNETTLRFLPDDEMVAQVRRDAGDRKGWIGRSRPPYTDWKWHEASISLGGPNSLRLPDGSLWAAGRVSSPAGGPKTVVARMSRDDYEPVLTLPSGGDTSYPGLVWNEGILWISYYSSHEGKSAIYLAKVKLPLVAKDSAGSPTP